MKLLKQEILLEHYHILRKKIANTIAGANPYMYPATDWYALMLNDAVANQRYNLNLSGGGTVARYYIAATFNQDHGLMKVDKRNNFNNNIDLKRYAIRSNVNINVTKKTKSKRSIIYYN